MTRFLLPKHSTPAGSRLTFVSIVGAAGANEMWLCKCSCGRDAVVRGRWARSGNTRSCGCMHSEVARKNARKHGHTKERGRVTSLTYRSWTLMKQRCLNAKCVVYGNYGGRGITVCERWLASFENFLSDMGERAPGTTLDRIDGSKGYEPGNCRWATPTTQSRNRSITKLNEVSADLIRCMKRRGATTPDLAHAFGVSGAQIKRVVSHELWRTDADERSARPADATDMNVQQSGSCKPAAIGGK